MKFLGQLTFSELRWWALAICLLAGPLLWPYSALLTPLLLLLLLVVEEMDRDCQAEGPQPAGSFRQLVLGLLWLSVVPLLVLFGGLLALIGVRIGPPALSAIGLCLLCSLVCLCRAISPMLRRARTWWHNQSAYERDE